MSNVFVAPKIRVGFQNRDDTFTGQLAYIIYYDEKGKIRKEKSWEGWRDKEIDPKEFENVPTEGFTINKDIKRYSGEWFSSTRTMIRIHDPRGFEFEVTTENLIGILMHTDCLRRGLIGEFVYAWCGTDLVLLPTNSEEYQTAVKYTSGLAKKVSAKSLTPGISYKTKREGDVIYIGRMSWYEYPNQNRYSSNCWEGERLEKKVHVFTSDDGKTFIKKSSIEFLAEPNNDTPVSNYASLVDKFNKKTYANKFVKFEFRPVSFNPETKNESYYGLKLLRSHYWTETATPNVFRESMVNINVNVPYNPTTGLRDVNAAVVSGYKIDNDYYYDISGIVNNTTKLVKILGQRHDRHGYSYNYNNRNKEWLSIEQIRSQQFYDLYVIYENGKERQITNLYELNEN